MSDNLRRYRAIRGSCTFSKRTIRESENRVRWPFHPHVRGLHHGIHPDFLQTSPGLSSLAVLPAPCAVARRTSGNAPNATHTDPTTAQALQSPQTLCRSPPPTTLYRLRTDDRCPSQDP